MDNRHRRHKNSNQRKEDYPSKRLTDTLPHFVDHAFFVIGAVLILAFSVGICEVIITSLVRFCEWFSGHKLPSWFHTTLLTILCVVLISLVIFVAYMHIKGMKVPPLEELETDDLSMFDEEGR